LTKIRLQIHGKVQGVFYRQSALEVAKLLGLEGWIKNNPDGTVEAYAVGRTEAIAQFTQWCRKGPSRAIIERLDVLEEVETAGQPDVVGFSGFRIIADS
jgi:acylphosphatase